MNEKTTYHKLDFLLPAQRFNINFSYVSQRGLPFVREFILRLVRLHPLSKPQLATFFGFKKREIDEAIDDLVARGELVYTESGCLDLTSAAENYFSDEDGLVQVTSLQENSVSLSFDLATFSCLGNDAGDGFRSGIELFVDPEKAARSQALVEKEFQSQFEEIVQKGYWSPSSNGDGKGHPSLYLINAVHKIRQHYLRLPSLFQIDSSGQRVEREDFVKLNYSDPVHGMISAEIGKLARPQNKHYCQLAAESLGDENTLKTIGSSGLIDFGFWKTLRDLEEHGNLKRQTFIGPIYLEENWRLFEQKLDVVLARGAANAGQGDSGEFLWIAPSDPFWGKCNLFTKSLQALTGKERLNKKKLFDTRLYLPVRDGEDRRMARYWEREMGRFSQIAFGLKEGFMRGNIETLCFGQEVAAVIYHLSLPERYPVTFPVGFITTATDLVAKITAEAKSYISTISADDSPNNCGPISNLQRREALREIHNAKAYRW